MDLNSAINISNNKQYNRQSVESRRVVSDQVPSFSGMNLDEQVSNFDDLVYGEYTPTPGGQSNEYDPNNYDAKSDLERMTQQLSGNMLANSKLPEAIKRSMASNPLIVEATDGLVDAMAERVAKANIDKSVKIMKDLEKIDAKKQTVNEQLRQPVQQGTIDYNALKTIVEQAIDKKIDELKGTLNESLSKTSNSPDLYVMKMGKKFLFLDNDNNIYECQMVYKGKNKAKRK